MKVHQKKNLLRGLGVLVTGFIACSVAQANVGTGLMLFATFHLTIGNALIGLFEGWVAARIFKLPLVRTLCLAIGENYGSVLLGLWILGQFEDWFGAYLVGEGLFRYGIVILAGLMVAAYILTIVLEWPLHYFMPAAKAERSISSAFRSSLVVQTLSYTMILFPFYFVVSPTSFLTETRLVDRISDPSGFVGWVYFIAPDGTKILRVSSAGGVPELIAPLESGVSEYARVEIQGAASKGRCELWLKDRDKEPVPILDDLSFQCELAIAGGLRGNKSTDLWFDFGSARRFSPAAKACSIDTDFWPSGFTIECLGKERKHLGFETVFGAWYFRSAFVLPDERAIFQGGGFGDQAAIYKLDLSSLEITSLALGYGPTVIREVSPFLNSARKAQASGRSDKKGGPSREPPWVRVSVGDGPLF